jgi:mRNA interferase HigB
MRVRLIRIETLAHFAQNHANGSIHFDRFLESIKYAQWERAEDITRTIKGNLLGNGSDRVVFDLGGNGRNAFRVICRYKFGVTFVRLFIAWVGTHEEYNRLSLNDKLTVWKY